MRQVHVFAQPQGDELEEFTAFCVEEGAEDAVVVFHPLPMHLGPARVLTCAACGESEARRPLSPH